MSSQRCAPLRTCSPKPPRTPSPSASAHRARLVYFPPSNALQHPSLVHLPILRPWALKGTWCSPPASPRSDSDSEDSDESPEEWARRMVPSTPASPTTSSTDLNESEPEQVPQTPPEEEPDEYDEAESSFEYECNSESGFADDEAEPSPVKGRR
ncbi:hypothetical protein OF83DRAFT_1084599 [Amylostereum chailletii]|nr:hypothetical protein OF83DRAFT_1084599 [Amylostereum chailletii]